MKILITTIFTVIMLVAFGSLVVNAINKSEISECKKWQSQAEEVDNYYITPWQYEQCSYHQITINAPIKNYE